MYVFAVDVHTNIHTPTHMHIWYLCEGRETKAEGSWSAMRDRKNVEIYVKMINDLRGHHRTICTRVESYFYYKMSPLCPPEKRALKSHGFRQHNKSYWFPFPWKIALQSKRLLWMMYAKSGRERPKLKNSWWKMLNH